MRHWPDGLAGDPVQICPEAIVATVGQDADAERDRTHCRDKRRIGDVTRVIHRTLAVTMIFSMIYHVLTIGLGTLLKLRERTFELRRTIIPCMKDIADFKEDMLYFAGKRSVRPEMDKFMYKQKIHYFAAAFGNSVMILSGSTFLFPDIWASILPVNSPV